MILSISGLHGTGKSTIAETIADYLGIKHYSTGEVFRAQAREMNMTVSELTSYIDQHPEVDKVLDDTMIKSAKGGNIVIDSQLSGHLLNKIADFKILLTCPLEIRIKRMAERDGTNYEEKLEETIKRERSEQERFKLLYNINLSDTEEAKKTYDLIIDTENLSIKDVLNKIKSEINKLK